MASHRFSSLPPKSNTQLIAESASAAIVGYLAEEHGEKAYPWALDMLRHLRDLEGADFPLHVEQVAEAFAKPAHQVDADVRGVA